MWRDYFETEYAIYNETVIFKAKVKYNDDVIAFSPPLGKDFNGGIGKITEYCSFYKLPLFFFNVTSYDHEMLHEIFGNFESCYNEDWSDYIYAATDLKTLAGRKFSGQRNHINQFMRAYSDFSFEEINKDNIPDVVEFFNRIHTQFSKNTDILDEEYIKTLEVFDNYDLYGMLGGLLRVNGSVIAFSFGEIINNVLFTHIEKADISYKGAYQVMNNQYANHFCSDNVKIINRAEDNGDEGLRTSKRSYHPCGIVNKRIAKIQL